MTGIDPGQLAHYDQKLAETIGELLSLASQHHTGDLVPDTASLTGALARSGLTRTRMAEIASIIGLYLLRERPDLYLWGSQRIPMLANDPPPAGPIWQPPQADIMARLVAGLPSQLGGTVPTTPIALNTIYARALDAIAELADDETFEAHTRMALITDVLDAIRQILETAP